MRIVFAGSPEFAVPALKKLVESGKEVVAVITQADKPAGRKRTLTPTPVKAYAQSVGLPVYDFVKIRNEAAAVRGLNADIMITCAYGQLLTQEILDCFAGGVWNIHASLLPKFRGASPIQAAILAGETHTGVTVMKTELALDSGDMLLVKRCEIGGMTCGELTQKLSLLGADAALEAAELLEKGDKQLLMQDDAKATYCKKITKEQGRLDFTRPADEVCRTVKAFSPDPAAYCFLNGLQLNILNAEVSASSGVGAAGEAVSCGKNGITVRCGDGSVTVTELQPAGGKKMRAADFINGRKIKAGDVFG